MRYWIVPMALMVFACGGSTAKKAITTNPIAVVENPNFDDFGATASADGQKAVLTSRRDAGAYRTYVYDESKVPKLFALQQSIALGTDEQEYLTTMSSDASWILTWRASPTGSHLILNSFDSTSQASILTSGSKIREIAMAPAGQNILAFTASASRVDSVKLYSFTAEAKPVLKEEASLTGESQPQFALLGSDLYVFTRVTGTDGAKTIKFRKRTGAGVWTEQTGTQSLTAAAASLPSIATSKGLFFGAKPSTSRQRAKLGSYTDRPVGYIPNVGISDELNQFASFGGSTVDFAAGNYRSYEPLSLIDVSASPDAAYMLITGTDAYFCKTATLGIHGLSLYRLSDGLVIPLFVSRDTGTLSWTYLVTNPCDYYDQSPIPKNQDFDTQISKAQLLSVTGTKVQILYETRVSGDREIRRISFDVSDWTNKTLGAIVFTDVSSNPHIL